MTDAMQEGKVRQGYVPDAFPSNVRSMPLIDKIVQYWREEEDTSWLASSYIGWGEAFCFGCGWLPPVPDGSRSWASASSWLERAHLQDHVIAGDDSPANLVMLCHLCHDLMPCFDDRDEALAWVQALPEKDQMWQLFTDLVVETDPERYRRESRTKTLRLRTQFLELSLEVRERVTG